MVLLCGVNGQVRYNHPELEWQTIETAHFELHYHQGAEWTARTSARIAETVYQPITEFFEYQPDEKTDLIIWDTDDISNGAAYYYDNKIDIWATPLDFLLRGNHNWLWDVIAHEFSHIVTLQKAMKYPRNFPAAYFQVIDYEDEKRDDVVYGYPRVIVSYPFPGLVIPMWLAEGVAQFQYPGSPHDLWDSHRDMILRDRVLHDNLLSLDQMGTFGKRGIGNESVYNQGLAFTRYLYRTHGEDVLPRLLNVLSNPLQFSVDNALRKVTGTPGDQIYQQWKSYLENNYFKMLSNIRQNDFSGTAVITGATTQIYPQWAGDSVFYYLSNKGRDYFSQTALYKYDIKGQSYELVHPKVRSRVTISPDGHSVYYSRKSKPDRHGSIFYDIYCYQLDKKEEKRITHFKRAYHPELSPDGEKIAYITGEDGTSNLVVRNLNSQQDSLLTEFTGGEQIFSVTWSPDGERIAFDYMTNHGRDILLLKLADGQLSACLNAPHDERNPYFGPQGEWLYYASDSTGIFNIYRKSMTTGKTELLTNVTGGAFMPSVSPKGGILYSLYDKGAYQINMIQAAQSQPKALAGYKPQYSEQIPARAECYNLDSSHSVQYHDQFSKFFVLPRLTLDYGKLKPGFYFYSSEIIKRFNIFGGASINLQKDHDLFLLLEYHQWDPTLFLEFYNISRGIFNQEITYNEYPIEMDYTFRLTEAVFGITRPLSNLNQLRFDVSYASYRTSLTEKIPSEEIYSDGFTYNYYKGLNFRLYWNRKKILPTVNQQTNPNNGTELNTQIARNYDKFLKEFGMHEDFGTLKEVYRDNYYWKIRHEGVWHHKYPLAKKLVGNLKWRLGWISKYDIDSFFNFFAGGLPGLRGYPFYSIEGRNLFSLHYTLRWPLFVEKNINLLMFDLQNAFVGTYFEAGNAWSQVGAYPGLDWQVFTADPLGVSQYIMDSFKRDVGLQLRLSGFSFYAYPTSISFDLVYGLDRFKITDRQDKTNIYGQEWRTYLTILFGL